MALVHPARFAILSASFAPRMKPSVTSFPLSVTALPPLISMHSLGDGNPPSISGQTGTAFPDFTSAATFAHVLSFPSWEHFMPARHALTIIMKKECFL
jgi:hypothetical protein